MYIQVTFEAPTTALTMKVFQLKLHVFIHILKIAWQLAINSIIKMQRETWLGNVIIKEQASSIIVII